MNIIISILIFSLIIVIHELGHFLLAKANGVFVTEFSVGMGPRIISLVKTQQGYRPKFFLSQHNFETIDEWKDHTKYSWKILPIGGSCMMLGEDETIEDDRAFNKKGVWARISVIFAGPLFNFILAFILAMFIIGTDGYDPANVVNVLKDSPAEKAGIQKGDIITNMNGSNVDIGREVASYLQLNPLSGKEITVTYSRNGEKNKVSVVPKKIKTYMLGFSYATDNGKAIITEVFENMPMSNAGIKAGDSIEKLNDVSISNGNQLNQYFDGNPLGEKPISITYSRNGKTQTTKVTPVLYSNGYNIGMAVNTIRQHTNVLGVIKYSAVEVKFWVVTTVKSLGQLIIGKVSTKDMAGPVGIVNMIGNTYQESKSDGPKYVFLNLAYISILLSANLGVMNLLPIPALDGGRLVFLFLEVLRGKPIDQAKEGFVHMVGLVLLMILMVFVMFNDISRLLF
jgi:regulator of sigma E protease